MSEDPVIKQTILYYPTISIPIYDGWLRQALLYWDEIGSIVPQDYGGEPLINYSPDIEYLANEGIFRPIRPELILQRERKTVKKFEENLVEIFFSDEFQDLLRSNYLKGSEAKIHLDKVSHEVFEFFREAGVAKEDASDHHWFLFERRTALLYMAVLAKFLADEDSEYTIPGTNFRLYERLNFQAKATTDLLHGLCLRLFNILPIPRREVSLHDIVDFKRRRKDQLWHFRQLIAEVQAKLSYCERKDDAFSVLTDFECNLRKGVADLQATLDDSRIVTKSGSFEALFRSSHPGWLAALAIAAGAAKKIAEIPVTWALGGALITGAFGIGHYAISKRNERKAEVRKSQYSYLMYAAKDRIID